MLLTFCRGTLAWCCWRCQWSGDGVVSVSVDAVCSELRWILLCMLTTTRSSLFCHMLFDSALLHLCHVQFNVGNLDLDLLSFTHTHTRTHTLISALFSRVLSLANSPSHTSLHLHFFLLSFISPLSPFHPKAIPRIHHSEVKRSRASPHLPHPSLSPPGYYAGVK